MTLAITFKESRTDATTTKEFPMGAVLPKCGDLVVSPFTEGKTAVVNEVAGDIDGDGFVLVTE